MNTRSAHEWLAAQRSEMVADLIAMCNQNSGSQNLAGLRQLGKWLSGWMQLPEAALRSIELAPREVLDDHWRSVSVATGPALRWDYLPEAPERVLLMIHYDTVFGTEHAFQRCERLSEELLRGPGVADAKGGIVVLRYAIQALQKFDLAPDLGWTILLNPDEEVGSPSSAPLLPALAAEFDFGLLFEPSLPSGELISERKGSGTFTVLVRGRAAHAGRYFHDGRNAIAELSRIVAKLDALNGQRADMTVNVGYISGGGPVNIVPDRATARVNVRVADMPSATWFEQQLRGIAREASEREGFACEVHGSFQSPPKRVDAAQREIMRAIEVSALNLGQPAIRWQFTGGVCDGNKLAAAGLPNIDTLGPRGDGLHSDRECVQVDSLVEKAQLLVKILSGFADGEFDRLLRQRR